MLLDDPAYTVPDPGPPGPYGTMAWLRTTVSRFSQGEAHTRRRALAERLVSVLDPAELHRAARRESKIDRGVHASACSRGVDAPYVPVAVLAARLGVADADVAEVVAATRAVAAAYHPHTADVPGGDEALHTLLTLLPAGEDEEATAQRVGLLVQACEATAGLVRGEALPVPATRRVGPDGRTVLVDLAGHPFGAGPRRCPAEVHARALADGVLER